MKNNKIGLSFIFILMIFLVATNASANTGRALLYDEAFGGKTRIIQVRGIILIRATPVIEMLGILQ